MGNQVYNNILSTAKTLPTKNRAAVLAYFNSLPAWRVPAEAGEKVVATGVPKDEIHDGKTMSCSTTKYNLITNPEQIVMFEPDLSVLWPGSLVQGAGLLSRGSLRELAIKKREPINVSINLLTTPHTLTVSKPSAAAVGKAIANLIEPVASKDLDFGSSISYKMKETYSFEQALLSLGLSAHYAGAEFSAKHTAKSARETSVVSVAFIQNLFSAYVDMPATPADLFSADFSIGDLHEQEALGRIGKDNLPVLLSTVTWGRILYVTISSSKSFDEIKNAISASYNAGGGGGSGQLDQESKKILTESQLIVSGIGIEDKNAANLIRAGKIQEFFSSKMNIRSARPISFIFYNVRDLSIAGLADSANYDVTVCRQKKVSNPSASTATRAAELEKNLKNFGNFVLAATSNFDDPDTRALRTSQYRHFHSAVVISWIGSGLTPKT